MCVHKLFKYINNRFIKKFFFSLQQFEYVTYFHPLSWSHWKCCQRLPRYNKEKPNVLNNVIIRINNNNNNNKINCNSISCWDDHICFSPTAPDSFCYKKFFQLCGLSQKSPQEVKDVFRIIDEDNSGFIEEAELKYVILAGTEFM